LARSGRGRSAAFAAALARACKEVNRYIREWDCGDLLHKEGRCRWEEGGRAVVVELLLGRWWSSSCSSRPPPRRL
jgi:hypothetical protein